MSKILDAFEDLKRQVGNMPYTSYENGLGHRTTFLVKDTALFPIIENALKSYVELTSKPAILYGRTHSFTQAILDTICKNYKEVKITNLDDEKKVKAFEIIKKKRVDITTLLDCHNAKEYNRWVDIRSHYSYRPFEITQEEYDFLKEVLL